MLKDVDYFSAPGQLFDVNADKLAEAERMIDAVRASSKERLRVAIHEANHKLEAKKLGMAASYGGPSIEHEPITNRWIIGFGRTEVRTGDYLRLSTEEMGRYNLAGRVAETVLLGGSPIDTSQPDFEAFIYSGRGKPSELTLLWKELEEGMVRELRSDLAAQQQIIHEAETFQREIFPDCIDSVKRNRNSPPRVAAR